MRLDPTPEEASFRAEARTWLAANVPADPRPREEAAGRDYDLAWQRTMYEGGWAGISWPAEHGGRGSSLMEQVIWYEEYVAAGAPPAGVNFVGLSHAGPTLIARGSEEQKRAHLTRILRGETVWCQGFSEPDSGSDLASLRTRGTVDGDTIWVTGRKIWTGHGPVADYQELLVRTDPTAEKHRGISWVICDMHSPGITVRPIKSLHGDYHFSEVTYDNVAVPVENVVGELNRGWDVARSTLGFERGTAFIADQVRLSQLVAELQLLAATRAAAGAWAWGDLDSGGFGTRLAQIAARVAGLRSLTYLHVNRALHGEDVGARGSIVRVVYSELWQDTTRLALEMAGRLGLAFGPDDANGTWSFQYLDSLRATIAAGTKDIQRNVIGERLLGLSRG
ncbi:MAG TPA: acyl-CoA dehydrogenase family protein [Trebonia sp.]|nr:acyl-CoA dehydrogenase family protein [Trebonia sp.]